MGHHPSAASKMLRALRYQHPMAMAGSQDLVGIWVGRHPDVG